MLSLCVCVLGELFFRKNRRELSVLVFSHLSGDSGDEEESFRVGVFVSTKKRPFKGKGVVNRGKCFKQKG